MTPDIICLCNELLFPCLGEGRHVLPNVVQRHRENTLTWLIVIKAKRIPWLTCLLTCCSACHRARSDQVYQVVYAMERIQGRILPDHLVWTISKTTLQIRFKEREGVMGGSLCGYYLLLTTIDNYYYYDDYYFYDYHYC